MKQEYTPEDIINDPEFIKWLTTGGHEGTYWQDYADQSSEHFQKVQKAIDLYNLRKDRDHAVDRQRINHRKEHLIGKIVRLDRIRKVKQAGVITSIAALLAVSAWFYFDNPSRNTPVEITTTPKVENNEEWISIQNARETGTKPVAFPDLSYVFLDPGSSIRYHQSDFTDKREVYLQGSGFFMVEHRDSTQFIVFSDQFETTVLGTEFYVSDQKDLEESYVKVTDGRVRVRKQTPSGDKEEVAVLTRMESVHVNNETQATTLKRENFNEATGTENIRESMTYRNAPVENIFRDLSRKFDVTIHFDKLMLKDCTLTASFNDKKLDQVLYIICKTLDASYLQSKGKIEIFSKGC